MMIFRSLDSDGDWQFGRGKNDYLAGDAAIGLNVRTRIMSWVNDCFFDLTAGIDWNNRIGKTNQKALLELDLRRIILTSEGVTGIIDVSTQLSGRSFSASYDIQTINSQSFRDNIAIGGYNA